MPENVRSYAQQGPGPQDQPSTTAVARDEAANVGRSAARPAAMSPRPPPTRPRRWSPRPRARRVTCSARRAGKRGTRRPSSSRGPRSQLRTVADELQEMAAKGGQSGLATEVAQQAAERIHGAASWLEQREPGDLLQAVRDFARRRPGVFLAGAAAAGLVAGA